MILRRIVIRIFLGAISGAIAGAIVMWLASKGVALFLAPLSIADQNSLDGNASLGFFIGFAIGAALVTKGSQDIPLWLQKIIGGLACWLGTTFTIIPLLFLSFSFYFVCIKGSYPPGSKPLTPASLFAISCTLPFGVVALYLSWKLCKFPSPREIWSSFCTAMCSVLLPRAREELELVVFGANLSRTEFEAGLEQRALPKNSFKKHVATVRLQLQGEALISKTKNGFALQFRSQSLYAWHIEVSASVSGTRIEARSRVVTSQTLNLVLWLVVLVVLTGFFVINTVKTLAYGIASDDLLVQGWILTAFWTLLLIGSRLGHYQAQKQEMRLIKWFCETFEVEILRREPLQRNRWLT